MSVQESRQRRLWILYDCFLLQLFSVALEHILFSLKQSYLLIPGLSVALHNWALTLLIILFTGLCEILWEAPGRGPFMVK